jgi:DNA-binding response OmpR family regulator
MEPCLVYPNTPSDALAQALHDLGIGWKGVASMQQASEVSDADGWSVCIVETDAEGAFSFCRALRANEFLYLPILVITERDRLFELDTRMDLFDDFACAPVETAELESRIRILLKRAKPDQDSELITYGPLALNTETYQAAIAGRPLDLTYMEYELLRFFASNPGKVFRRETLLNRVWGYDYFGGARTVDVHVRRLRAKLGEEHANLIQTVRSVGYRFGQVRWGAAADATEPRSL